MNQRPPENLRLLSKCVHVPSGLQGVIASIWTDGHGKRRARLRLPDKSLKQVMFRDLKRPPMPPGSIGRPTRRMVELAAACGLTVAQVREALA